MQPADSYNGALLVVAFMGITFSMALVFHSVPIILAQSGLVSLIAEAPAFEATEAVPALADQVETVGKPKRLRIPAINIDASIEYVGLTPLGAMDSPAGPNPVGWYEHGPRPGEIGSAVVDGHSGWKNDIPAVFDDLNKLRRGDKVYVEDDRGIISIFVVREIRIYNPDSDAAAVFGSTDGLSHLNLITCTGTWDAVARSSSNRLIVFTDKE